MSGKVPRTKKTSENSKEEKRVETDVQKDADHKVVTGRKLLVKNKKRNRVANLTVTADSNSDDQSTSRTDIDSDECPQNETSEKENGHVDIPDAVICKQGKTQKSHAVTEKRGKQKVNQGFVHVNSKVLTKESLKTLSRLDTVSALLPTISNPVENEVTFSTNPQPVTDIFKRTTIPSYFILQLWKKQLQQHSQDTSCEGYYYIEVRDCRYDLEAVELMLILHKARDIRTAVEKELEWFAGQLKLPKCVVRSPSSDSLKTFQNLVFHQKWDEELLDYDMTGDELARICCDRWISDDIIKWTLNLMIQSQQQTMCLYHHPHHPHYVQECLQKLKQTPEALFIVFSVGLSKSGVYFSSDTQVGCHLSFCYITNHDGFYKAVYGDFLGWPAPARLKDIISVYIKFFNYQSQGLEIRMCHDPAQNNAANEHTCSDTCVRMFPLYLHGSISGVLILMMAALACFKRDFFHLLIDIDASEASLHDLNVQHLTCPSNYAKYLRRVLATWIADKEICVDYLIPRRFENDATDEEENEHDELEEERGGDEVESNQRVSDATLQGNSNQDDSSNVQSPPNNSQQAGASIKKKSLEPNEPTQVAQVCLTGSSIITHKCPNSECTYKTSLAFNMKRHVRRNHPGVTFTPPLAHNCPVCSFGSSKPTDITIHVNGTHPGIKWMPPGSKRGPKAKEGPKRYKCPQCDYKSNSKHNINRHQQSSHHTMHMLESSRTGKCQCLECGDRLYKISDLRKHLSTKHAFIFKTETVTLASYEEFEEWKASIEIAEGSSFTKTTGDKVIQGNKRTQYFQCNRSGMYRSNNKGKRRQKWQGSCKIESNCTATMVVSIMETGKVEIECVCTHYSHQIELQHVWIPKGFKQEGTFKSTRSQTRDEVAKDVCKSADIAYGRQHVRSQQEIPDIVDIFAASVIQCHNVTNDQQNLLSWIKQWEESSNTSPVLMYKMEGISSGFDFNGLQEDDYLMVVQSELQKEMMLKFCPNGMCCDSTELPPVSKMMHVLTSLQVIDDIGQTLPIAWCFSSSNKDSVIKAFFTKLKQVCGDLTPAWFMSLWQERFYELWTLVFGCVRRHLLCPWSVKATWSEMLKKTLGNALHETSRAHKLLKILLEQTDQKLFEDHLQTLLDWLSVPATRQEFKRNFLRQWVSRKQEWMYCGNKDDTFFPNTFIEPFYQSFQSRYSHANSSERLDTMVFLLMKYVRDIVANRCISLTKGKPVTQGTEIQRRHAAGMDMEQSCVRACLQDPHRWDVIENNQVKCTVQESASVCKFRKCPISCLECNICFHQYLCTCLDNLTNITICKHIHLVHSTLHKHEGTAAAPVKDTQWLKDRIQSRVHRLLAVVNSTGDEHYSVLQELDSKLGVCSSLLDPRLLWGPTDLMQRRQDEASQHMQPRQDEASQQIGVISRKDKRKIDSGGRRGMKKKWKKQDGDVITGKDKDQKGALSVNLAAASGSVIQDGSTPVSQAITTMIPPTAPAAIFPIHLSTSLEIPSMHTDHPMTVPQPTILTTDSSMTSSHPHTSQPSVMTSQIELQPSLPSSVMSFPSPRPITSTIIDHPHSHQFTTLSNHQPIIHTPGSSGSISHHLSGIHSYQPVRPVLASQLPSPAENSHHVHMDHHQAVRPLAQVESQQLASMSDEQLTTLAGVASALFGDT